ncbi:DUF6934 family protein [Parasediminibacterium sp. JCM 36343]|uniref:DUF6934 family protein n=1 Tax=Parasediminibacterium sp. JCM 36343 TaxID=3374279 RepID=UPI00397A30A7
MDKYDYIVNTNFTDYAFQSQGPNGTIEKIARFSLIDIGLYNFGFGDYNPLTGKVTDTITSNNKDVDKIMGTVGSIIFDFTTVYYNAEILVQGTTPARTRLYQAQIGKHWESINIIFEVMGFKEGKWTYFEKGVNYEAFTGWRKNNFSEIN